MSKYKRYWELQGKRRPFPPLYEAVKMYGAENVFSISPSTKSQDSARGVAER